MSERKSMDERIASMPEYGEWWKSDGEEAFRRIARQLVARGFTEDEAVRLLEEVYGIVAGEFGC